MTMGAGPVTEILFMTIRAKVMGIIQYNVPCRRYLLGSWIHHSVGYTVLLPTALVVITIFLYNQFWLPDVSGRSLDVLAAGC
jgi:hypothetical protein